MKKIFVSLMLVLAIFSLSSFCVFAATNTATDYICYDFTGNTVTNGKPTDVSTIAYIPKDNEANNPFKSSIVYGAFGKDATDAAYRFTSEWNASSLPTDTSVGKDIKNPFIQFATGGMKTVGTNDVVHISYDMYIDGEGFNGYGEIRPYKYGSNSLARFYPTCTYISFKGETISKAFYESVSSAAFKPNQWSRIEVVIDAQAKATVNGSEVDCSIANIYFNGQHILKNQILDGDNTVDGYQLMGGLDHIRFFLNPAAVNGVYPKTSTYLDNISVKIYRDGTIPEIIPESELLSSMTSAGASVINNTKNTIITTGYTADEFLKSITASDSYNYTYVICDAKGNTVSANTEVIPGYYLRATNTKTATVSYYQFIQNNSASVASDILNITSDDEIFGYKEATIQELINMINFPYGSTYSIKSEAGSIITDFSKPAVKGLTITVTSSDGSATKIYTLSESHRNISSPSIVSGGYNTETTFTEGIFTASVDVTNYTKQPLQAKVVVAQYSANGRLKAYCMGNSEIVETTKTISSSMNVKTALAGDFAKVYVLDSINAPLTECATLYAPNQNITNIINTYPTYTTKALTFSFDDGDYGNTTSGDKRIIDIFDKYGIKATWNLVASRVNSNFMNKYANDYFGDGDEVANHSYAHKRMSVEGSPQEINGTMYPPFTTDECKAEIKNGKDTLENLFGIKVESFVWPFGPPSGRSDYAQLVEYLKELGIKYARPTGVSGSFDYPANWYNWKQTARIMNPDDYLESFLALPAVSSNGLKMFSIWGHAYELTNAQKAEEGEEYYEDMDYDELDAFCKTIYDEGETWFATNMELYDYYTASNALVVQNGIIYNNSDIDLYAIIDGQSIKIPAHGIGGKK